MKPLAFAILTIFVILISVSVAHQVADALTAPTAAEIAADYARAERIRVDAELYATWAPVTRAVQQIVLYALLLGVVAFLGTLGALFLRRYHYERTPNRYGLLPVLASDQETARAALGAYHVARIEDARRAIVPTAPATLTYAPHYAPQLQYRGVEAAQLPGDEVARPGAFPTFAELLAGGRIGRGPDGRVLPLLLGIDAESGAELPGSWLDLYSTAVGGLPGSGKTTTQRFLAAQTVLLGARFVVIDPHAEAGDDSLAATLDPLRACYLCDPASDDAAILEAVRLVDEIGRGRVQGRDPDQTPVILWADELTKLLGRSAIGDELAQLLEAVAQEYRKKRVFICGSGQIWTAARVTSELRDSFASVIAHRMKRGQARMLLPTDEAAQVERLDTGRAVLWRTSGATVTIAVPNTTAADVRQVATLVTPATGVTTAGIVTDQPGIIQPGAAEFTALERVKSLSPEMARAVELFLGGMDAGAIVSQLTGMKSRDGRPYMKKLAEVQDAIRFVLLNRRAA